MSKLIQLHDVNSDLVYFINPKHIIYAIHNYQIMDADEKVVMRTTIRIPDGGTLYVEETPEEIERLLIEYVGGK